MSSRRTDCGGRGGVGAVGVEQDRHSQAELREHVPAEPPQAGRSPAVTSLPPMKMAVRSRSLGPAREDRAVHQIRICSGRTPAVAEDLVRAGVDRHNAVEDAGLRIAVELDQDGGLS